MSAMPRKSRLGSPFFLPYRNAANPTTPNRMAKKTVANEKSPRSREGMRHTTLRRALGVPGLASLDRWQVAGGRGQVTGDGWQETGDRGQWLVALLSPV